jgi:hypothetical protein
MLVGMDCQTNVRLQQIVMEAALSLDANDSVEANLDKRRTLRTAEVNAYEHSWACTICRPMDQEVEIV